MTTILKYKDYLGSAEVDVDHGVLRGKLLFVGDVVTYEAATPRQLQRAFEAAVNDYVTTCAALGKAPQKSFTGQFNVRIDPDDHRASAVIAASQGISLNAVVAEAVHDYVHARVGRTARAAPALPRPKSASRAPGTRGPLTPPAR